MVFFRKQYLIHGGEVREIIKQTFHTDKNIFISDRKYKLVSIGMLKMYLRFNQVNKIRYTSDEFDCDDFAMKLATDVRWWFKGSTFGIVWTGSHALNFFIDRDKKVWLVEPQTDEIFEVPEDKRYTFIYI